MLSQTHRTICSRCNAFCSPGERSREPIRRFFVSVFFSVPGAEEGAVHAREQAVLPLTSAVGNPL